MRQLKVLDMIGYSIIFLNLQESGTALKDKKLPSPYKLIMLEQTVPEQTVYARAQKPTKPRKRIIKKPFISGNKEKIKTIIRDIWNLFDSEEKKGELKRLEKERRLIKKNK